MTIQEIDAAMDKGQVVCWCGIGYTIVRRKTKDSRFPGGYEHYIKCSQDGHMIGLVGGDGTFNVKPEELYIRKDTLEATNNR